jgi:glycerophosphoryl diester phosphodiesterase
MTPKELIAQGGLYFEKIQNGMTDYQWESRFFSPQMAEEYLRKLWRENGKDNSFVDCYFPFLEEESKERVLSVLDGRQQEYLNSLTFEKGDFLTVLDEELLSIAVALIDKEMLFFSFYFTKNPCTVWGNYKQEYLIFTKKEECKKGERHMRIFAHRGFSGRYPENTMLAFKKAYAEGCDGIELDVQLTKDDIIVIMHDETVDRTTSNGHGNLRDYTYKELCKFDCCGKFPGKYSFQRIPTLREYLEWVKKTDLITNIELKNSVYYYEGLEEKVISMVKDMDMENRVIFSSFNHISVLKCKKMMPEIPAGFLMETRMDNMGTFARENNVEFYHPDKEYLDKKLIQDCRSRGIGINVWTVNKKKDIKQMDKWKVDGIFTNYPDRANKLRKQGVIS